MENQVTIPPYVGEKGEYLMGCKMLFGKSASRLYEDFIG